MAYYERLYKVHLILGDPASPPVWHWTVWNRLFPHLDALVRHARAPVVTSPLQFRRDTRKPVSFGRIGWRAEAHQKWTHDSPVTADVWRAWKFLSAEIWAPSRGACDKDNRPPDVFIFMRNENFWGEDRVTFNPTALVAVGVDLPKSACVAAQQTAEVIARMTNARLRATKERPWGFACGSQAYEGALADIAVVGLFKVGPLKGKPPSKELLAEEWDVKEESIC